MEPLGNGNVNSTHGHRTDFYSAYFLQLLPLPVFARPDLAMPHLLAMVQHAATRLALRALRSGHPGT